MGAKYNIGHTKRGSYLLTISTHSSVQLLAVKTICCISKKLPVLVNAKANRLYSKPMLIFKNHTQPHLSGLGLVLIPWTSITAEKLILNFLSKDVILWTQL